MTDKALIGKRLLNRLASIAMAAAFALSLTAGAFANGEKTTGDDENNKIQFSNDELLEKSQISYAADGGFTGVRSFSVIISCVNGRISTLKTIRNPRVTGG